MSGTVLELPICKLDTFANKLFCGEPTAVCVPEAPLDDATMQAIATEDNLAEMAFIGRRGGGWWIRWFTPMCAVNLTDHPTLSAAAVVFSYYGAGTDHILFEGTLGTQPVERKGDFLPMDFRAMPPRPEETPAEIVDAVGTDSLATFRMSHLYGAEYRMLVYRGEARLLAPTPRFEVLKRRRVNIIATAPGQQIDFVRRIFCPAVAEPEDSVTGSAHCTTASYWAEPLGRKKLVLRQLSSREPEPLCEVKGDRILLSARCVPFLEGQIRIEAPRAIAFASE